MAPTGPGASEVALSDEQALLGSAKTPSTPAIRERLWVAELSHAEGAMKALVRDTVMRVEEGRAKDPLTAARADPAPTGHTARSAGRRLAASFHIRGWSA